MHIPRKEWDQEFDSRHRKIAILLDEGELNIREACNKLLHSKEIRFVVSDSPMTSQLAPRFNLSECAEIKGALGRENWTVIMNVMNFAAAAYFSAGILADAEE